MSANWLVRDDGGFVGPEVGGDVGALVGGLVGGDVGGLVGDKLVPPWVVTLED